jgi:hypothetical protein
MDGERLPQRILNRTPTGRKKEGDQKQDGKKAYSELWNNVVYEMETGRTDFFGDWVSKDVAIRCRTTTYIHTYIHTRTHAYIHTLYLSILLQHV